MVPEECQKSATKMVPFQKRVKNRQQKWYHFSQKRVKFLKKMVPFQKRVKNLQQKWYHFRKGSKILNKNGTITEKGKNSSTKLVPFYKRVKIPQQKMVPFQSEKVQNSSTKWYRFKKCPKYLNTNGTITEKGKYFQQNWYHFTKGSKFLNKKWYHFSQKRVEIPQQNGTISKNAQNTSTKMVAF